ncbi:MAG: DUF4965 domain-containing protein [Pirellulales bacterium]
MIRTTFCLAVLACGIWQTFAFAANSEETRPEDAGRLHAPAVPLVACDPYFSIWSTGARLTDVDTTHWTGKPHRLASLIRIDGGSYRLMGSAPANVPPLEQTKRSISPTQTGYRFSGAGVEVRLTFTTPALPDDIDLLSRPITYLTCNVRSADGKPHQVQIYFEAYGELAVNSPDQTVAGNVERPAELVAAKVGSLQQSILGRAGDDLRIDWGYFYLAAPASFVTRCAVDSPIALRETFINESDAPRQQSAEGALADQLAVAMTFDMSEVGSTPVVRWLMLAYDDLYSIEYMGRQLQPYWRRNGLDAHGLLVESARDYAKLLDRCNAFDRELTADLERAGGKEYAHLAALSYRQCFAAGKFVADANGQPIQFCKENHSNGCIATSDVFYPMSPQFLLFGPSLAKSFVVPFMNYAASERWKFPFAPHDLGTYPKANGQVYGGGETSERDQMPVEESGNLLILFAAIAKMDGNAKFADRYWPQLQRWAEYLKEKGFDPDNQLCTDDFAGHLGHNVNLSAKAICGLGAFAQLCELRGDRQLANEYRAVARECVAKWIAAADDGDHFRLAFDRPGSWSQKYNLVWDRVLGLNLFPEAVLRKEMDHYRRIQNRFGLPLDNRERYTKLDWILWTATLTQDKDDFHTLVAPVYRFLEETPDKAPLTDWYQTDTGKKVGFTARPVVGGVFMQLLHDGDVWKKWAKRDQTSAGGYAQMPLPPVIVTQVPAADTAPAPWQFTTMRPDGDWKAPEFDASSWQLGAAGFGTYDTPGTNVQTVWNTPEIWLRRTFDVTDHADNELRLHVHHDEDAEVYINGVLAQRLRGYTSSYQQVPILPAALAAIKPTGNVLTVHCRQTSGGQYIDVGVVALQSATD